MAFFSRLGRLWRGFWGLFVGDLEERNPEALMETSRQDFRDKMAQYNQALARMAGLAERLKNQIKSKTTKATELEKRILANHKAGNMELAGTLARELGELKSDLKISADELKDTEEGYQSNLRQAKVTQKEFEDKIQRLQKQISQVKIKEAQAEAAAALSNVAFEVGDIGDTMKRVEEILEKRYEESAGKARLAKDMMDVGQIEVKEKERKALEQDALAEFLAEQGIQAEPESESSGSSGGDGDGGAMQKEIGPAKESE